MEKHEAESFLDLFDNGDSFKTLDRPTLTNKLAQVVTSILARLKNDNIDWASFSNRD
jgi:hypothetical protein